VNETHWLDDWAALLVKATTATIEEFWLARLQDGVGDGADFVEALKRLRQAGKKTLAATLIELAADEAKSEGAWSARKRFLAEMLRLGIGDEAAMRAGLEECVRKLWADRPSLEKLLQHFDLAKARKPLLVLDVLEAWLAHDIGQVFSMAGRGPGRVVEASPQLGVLRLDFERERRVPVPIDAAQRFLTPLPVGHFLRRRLEEKDRLRDEVVAQPAALFGALLASFAEPLTVPEIKAALTGLVTEAEWTSWWNRAKKNAGVVASGSGTRVRYRLASAGGAEDEIRVEFAAASPEGQVELARRHSGRSRELATFMAGELLAVGARTKDAGIAWDAVTLAARLGASADQVRAAEAAVAASFPAHELLAGIGDVVQREAALEFIRAQAPAVFTQTLSDWLTHEHHPKLLTKIAAELIEHGEATVVTSFLDQVFLHPQRHPAAIMWACETQDARILPLLSERHSGALLVRLVELAERKEFTPMRARLREVLSVGGMGGRLVQEKLTLDQGRRLLQVLETPGELVAERNWLRRAIDARFPELRQATTGDFVPALAGTVARLQDELRRLREQEIPQVLKTIQVAKEHGDLTENFEYHAARSRQEYLSARATEIQATLGKVRVINPATVDTTRVRVGTRVWLEAKGKRQRSIAILGPEEAKEARPEAGIVSNVSDAGMALLDRAPGEAISLEGESWVVARIEPWPGDAIS
jgi:transcription elongation factor GreA